MMTFSEMELRVLDMLSGSAVADTKALSVRLGISEAQAQAAVTALHDKGAMLGYTAHIDWSRVGREDVQALIEVRVSPQRDRGFDTIAASMIRFDEVRSAYLVSGGFDIMLIVEAMTLKELAMFVSERLSVMDGVLSCATHFVLKKYKSEGIILGDAGDDERLAVCP